MCARPVARVLLTFLLLLPLIGGLGGWLLAGQQTGELPPPRPVRPAALEPVPSEPDFFEEPAISVAISSAAAPLPAVQEPAIQGRVIDGDDNPVADAAVALYAVEHGVRKTFTNSEGRFAVGDLAPGSYRVSAQREHFNEGVAEVVPSGTKDLVLRLTRMSRATGQVLDEAGEPLGAFDVVYLQVPPADAAHWREIVRNERTFWQRFSDDQGRFEIGEVASGAPFALGARAAGYEPAYVVVDATAPGEAAPPAEIRLHPEARIAGIVRSPGGVPLSGAVIYEGEDAEGARIAETNNEGQFELAGLGDAPLVITANHEGYLSATVTARPRRASTTPVTIVLGEGGAIAGTVTSGGAPAAGVAVVISRLTPPRIRKQVLTDAEGVYAAKGIGLGIVDVLLDGEDEGPRLHQQAEVEAGGTTVIDFEIPSEFAALEGHITVNGEAAGGAEVRGTVYVDGGQSFFSASTGGDGTYRIQNLPEGRAWVEASVARGVAELRRNAEVELRAGTVARLDVAFDSASGITGVVSGMQEGDVGQVLAFAGHVEVDTSTAEAVLETDHTKTGEADIDEWGAFEIQGLEPGAYTLVAIVFSRTADSSEEAFNTVRIASVFTKVLTDGSGTAMIELGR